MQNLKKQDLIETIEGLAQYVSRIVSEESGNILGPSQQSMVMGRLKKRMLDLGGLDPLAYKNYLTENLTLETQQLVSLMTTHHTFFFREFVHFEYLLSQMQDLVARVKKRGDRTIKVFSAACSRGQEVYSLGMFFEYHLKSFPGITYEILGADIDPESVKIAQNGVFPYKEIKSIPQIYLNGHWQRGTQEIAHFAKVKANIKDRCQFVVGNLLNQNENHLKGKKFDIIFCRNVFIYFDKEKISQSCMKLKNHLSDGGVLVTGLSESLKDIELTKTTVGPNVYSFEQQVSNPKPSLKVAKQLIPRPMRILAVDDSPSVLKLLGKIFESDPDFKLVGTAENGQRAHEFLQNHQVDAMTLDIHMPELDGVEYLRKHFSPTHPKVVVVSSASREDTRYAQKTIEFGASDFVEKPALNNLKERAEEIKNKLKMSFLNSGISTDTDIDRQFSKKFVIDSPNTKAFLWVANYSDLAKIKRLAREFPASGTPPLFIFFEGNRNFLEITKKELQSARPGKIHLLEDEPNIGVDQIFLGDFKEHFLNAAKKFTPEHLSIGLFGPSSGLVSANVSEVVGAQLLIEDHSAVSQELKDIATDIFPWTSFAHLATEFLAKE